MPCDHDLTAEELALAQGLMRPPMINRQGPNFVLGGGEAISQPAVRRRVLRRSPERHPAWVRA